MTSKGEPICWLVSLKFLYTWAKLASSKVYYRLQHNCANQWILKLDWTDMWLHNTKFHSPYDPWKKLPAYVIEAFQHSEDNFLFEIVPVSVSEIVDINTHIQVLAGRPLLMEAAATLGPDYIDKWRTSRGGAPKATQQMPGCVWIYISGWLMLPSQGYPYRDLLPVS